MTDKKTATGWDIKARAFLAVDLNEPAAVAEAAQRVADFKKALADLGFTDVAVDTRFRHRRQTEAAQPAAAE